VVGIITAVLRRRSDSVWPGVAAHAFNNSITVIAYAIAQERSAGRARRGDRRPGPVFEAGR
jgi:hypothetical protein